MFHYTGMVGFSNIFIGPRFSSNQLVRRSVCRSRHHQQHYNTVEANRAMQCNSMQVDYRVIMVTIKVIMVIIIIIMVIIIIIEISRTTMCMMMIMMELEGWRMGPRSVRGWIKGSTPLWSLLQHTQSRHNTATTHTSFHKSATSMPVFLCSFVLIVN